MTIDLTLCESFEVKSPFGPGFALVEVGRDNPRLLQLAGSGANHKLFELFYNVCGIVPPVNNIGYFEQNIPFQDAWGGIRRAHAIFQGLKRPCTSPGKDGQFYTYVTKPKFRYKFEPSMVCCARRVEVTGGRLFVAVVSFKAQDDVGKVLNWEWVEADPSNEMLPVDFKNRYDLEVWNNG